MRAEPEVPQRLLDAARALPSGPGRQLVALVGPPASGKSTLAGALAAALARTGRSAMVVPMDGFHLGNAVLAARGLLARKGAPESFDRDGLAAILARLAAAPRAAVAIPLFDRARDLAEAGAAIVPADCDLVIVEGNYLLLDEPGWRDLAALWSLSARLDPPEAVLRARLLARWAAHGLAPAEAAARVDGNDLPNAARIRARAVAADLTL